MGPESEAELALVVPQRRLLPVLLVLAAALAVGGFFVHRAMHAPLPLRVLVAVDLDGLWWEGSEPAAILADDLADRLEKLGFEPVRSGDPEVTRVLETAHGPEEAARSLRAAFVVTAALTPEVHEHPVEGGYFELRVAAPLEVRHLGDENGKSVPLEAWSGAKRRPDAVRLLARSLGDLAFDATLASLLAHPTVADIFQGNDAKLAGRVQPARDYVERRDALLAEARVSYEKLEKERRESEHGGAKVTYLGGGSATQSLGGVGAGGALVKTAGVRPFVSPRTRDLTHHTELETLEWASPGAPPKRMWSGYNLFGYPSVAPAGSPAVLVEDLFGWAKTLTVVAEGAAPRRLRIDAEHRFVDPRVAPGGAAAALYDRACRKCGEGLLVVALDDGRTLWERPAEEATFAGYVWLDARRLAFLASPHAAEGEEPEQAAWILDTTVTPPAASVLKAVPRGERWSQLAASARGDRLVFVARRDEGVGLAVLAIDGGEVTRHDVGGRVDSPALSPDARRVAFVQDGDIALVELAGGPARRLTKNRFRERYPVFSPDGALVYFESLAKDPAFPRRTVSVVGVVPVDPAAVAEAAAP